MLARAAARCASASGRGNYFQARDPGGNKYPVKWRSMNTGKMSRFSEGANHGMRELVSSRLWNLAGVVAPEFQHVHFRVIDGASEQTDQYHGDFYGLAMIFEDVDATVSEEPGSAARAMSTNSKTARPTRSSCRNTKRAIPSATAAISSTSATTSAHPDQGRPVAPRPCRLAVLVSLRRPR